MRLNVVVFCHSPLVDPNADVSQSITNRQSDAVRAFASRYTAKRLVFSFTITGTFAFTVGIVGTFIIASTAAGCTTGATGVCRAV